MDLIYPPKCIICETILSIGQKNKLCLGCKSLLEYIKEPSCISCGIPLRNEKIKKCIDCTKEENIFKKNIAVFVYDDILKQIMYNFKYGKKAGMGSALGFLMCERLKSYELLIKNIDYIAPIPIHNKRMKKRGFNQSELLAKEISKEFKKPLIKNLLFRTKNTKPQSGFSRVERKNNLKEAFIINKKYNLNSKKILLVDDIYTTGSTFNESAKILYDNNALEVFTISLSIVVKI